MTTLARLRFVVVRANQYSEWVHAEITDAAGAQTVVEVTLGDRSAAVVELLTEAWTRLEGVSIEHESDVPALLRISNAELRVDLVSATAVSALRSAIVQLQAAGNDVSLTEELGGERRESVPLYANINRSLFGDRSVDAFAAAARRAVDNGYLAIKCAPFDEVDRPASVDEVLDLAGPGLDRLAAVVEVVGTEATVLVDCHSRFQAETAPIIGERLAELGVGWYEEPLDPKRFKHALIQLATGLKLPLAGGEMGYGADFFTDLITSDAVEIVMPDVKHCGGVAEARKSGVAAIQAGGRISLHSPTGPVSHLAGGYVTAAVAGAFNLEHAVGETELARRAPVASRAHRERAPVDPRRARPGSRPQRSHR